MEERDEECGGEVKWRRMSRIVKEREEKYGGRGARGERRNRVLEMEGGGEWIVDSGEWVGSREERANNYYFSYEEVMICIFLQTKT